MAFAEDLSAFFDVAEGFAVVGSWWPLDAAVAEEAALIFDPNGHVDAASNVAIDAPVAQLPATAWPAIREDDRVEIQGHGNFTVRQVLMSGDGAIKQLVLAAIC